MTSPKTMGQSMQFEDIRVGQTLPALDIPVTVTLIAGGAIATRDYFPGHHDADAARAARDDFAGAAAHITGGRASVSFRGVGGGSSGFGK